MNQFKVGDVVKCIDSSYATALDKGEEYTVVAVVGEYIEVHEDGDFECGEWVSSRFELVSRPSEQKSPEEIAPLLWNAYKDVLNEEALEALRDVILNPPSNFVDCPCILDAFTWYWTKQGEGFWNKVYMGKYNKPTESHSEHLYEDERLMESIAQLEQIKDTGSAATSKHYNKQPIQSIELMEALFTREEFIGFCKGNFVKYAMRAGSKEGESSEKDHKKALQYKMWWKMAEEGKTVDPRKDFV